MTSIPSLLIFILLLIIQIIMGVAGLLKVVNANAPVVSLNSNEFINSNIGYDIQGLLHRAKFKCDVEQIATLQQAGEQVPMSLWSPLFDYVLANATHVATRAHSTIFVIDGAPLPSKKDEIIQRKQSKAKSFADALKLKETDMAGARKKFAASIEVSIDPVRNAIIERLSSVNLTIIQSPNEGDAQLAWLMKSNCIDVVFCNDSDLLVYNCERVVVIKSTNDPCTGSEYRINDVFNEADHLLSEYTADKLTALALVCGCDFSDGITGIGWTKGVSLIRNHWNEDTPLDLDVLINAAKAIGSNVVVPSNFIEQFRLGFITFKHQRVFNSSTNTIQYLSSPRDDIIPSFLVETLGEPITDTSISQAVGSGFFHPLELKPYDEVLPVEKDNEEVSEGAVESKEYRARIIRNEMDTIEQEFNDLGDDEREALSNEYNEKLLLLEQEMKRKKAIDPLDRDVLLWEEREVRFEKYEQQYQSNIAQHGTGNVNKKRVIQWTMFVIEKMVAEHGVGVSGYGLKARIGRDGTPLRNEDMMYIVDNSRNPTVSKITSIDQAEDSTSTAHGRHYKRSECRRYDNDFMEDESDSNQQLIHRFIQYPEPIRGDDGAYYGELSLTKVLFVVLGNVLNRTYIGRPIDPFGLKEHCFGLSIITNFSELLDNNAMGICIAQTPDIMHHFQQNFTTSFMTVKVADRARVTVDPRVTFTTLATLAEARRRGKSVDYETEAKALDMPKEMLEERVKKQQVNQTVPQLAAIINRGGEDDIDLVAKAEDLGVTVEDLKQRVNTNQNIQDLFTATNKLKNRQLQGEKFDATNEEIIATAATYNIKVKKLLDDINAYVNGCLKAGNKSRYKQQLDLLEAGGEGEKTVHRASCNKCTNIGGNTTKFVNGTKPNVQCHGVCPSNCHRDWTVEEPLSPEECKRIHEEMKRCKCHRFILLLYLIFNHLIDFSAYRLSNFHYPGRV